MPYIGRQPLTGRYTLLDNIETAKILSALGCNIVKIHSLYIAKNTKMAQQYNADEFKICSKRCEG